VKLADEHDKIIILPVVRSLRGDDEKVELRIIAAKPRSRVLFSRVGRVGVHDLSVRAVVMLRDLVGSLPASREVPKAAKEEPGSLTKPAHSAGRGILATNGTLFGGFLGYSLQRAAESDDPRLLYPMIAVGAGVGLGAAIIVSDEWDVGVGDAWYLAAGAWWPAVAGHLIHEGRFVDTVSASDGEPWSFGVVGAVTGLTLSTVGLLSRGMGDGGAVLAHSGGAVGLVVGGLSEFVVTGTSDEIPFGGMGSGAAAGWMLASATAILYHPDPTRVLTIDLGMLLGGLGGASAASPLIFDEPTEGKTRGWVAATGGGLLVGGGIAWWLSGDDPDSEPAKASLRRRGWLHRVGVPLPSVIGTAATPGEVASPGVGVTLQGQLW